MRAEYALWVVLLTSIVVACASVDAPNQPLAAERALLEQAIEFAGGEAALARSPVLAWTGLATVHAGGRDIEIAGEWTVRPPDYAVSTTWPRDQDSSKARKLWIEGESGTMTREGRTTPMPPAMLDHERQQFGLYGLMRLVSLRGAGVRLAPSAADAQGRRGLRALRAGLPDTDLYFDPDGRLAALATTVHDPESGRAVRERIDFEGSIEGAGIRWPRSLSIRWDGAPYFDLTLTSFTPRARL